MNEQQQEIFDLWIKMPVKSRMQLYGLLGKGIAADLDNNSAGRPENTNAYTYVAPEAVHSEGKIMTGGSHVKAGDTVQVKSADISTEVVKELSAQIE